MRVGIVSHVNPSELTEYLYADQDIPDTKVMASSVHALIIGLLKLGHRVTVFCYVSIKVTGLNLSKELNGERLTIVMCPIVPKLDFLIRQYYLPKLISRMIKLHIEKIDVLHSQWTYENSAAIIPFAGRIPLFCSVRDWWPIQNQFVKNREFMVRYYWEHANRQMFYATMEEDKICKVANSKYTQKLIKDYSPSIEVPIIPNPIKSNLIIEKKEFKFTNIFITITSSVFDERKNCATLIKAFGKYRKIEPNARLIVIGPYSEEHKVYKEWVSLGLLDGVELCGYLDHKEVINKLDEASVLIHPSYEETFGNILLEGMARRLLVVGGIHSGAVPYVLGDGNYGVLCDVSLEKSILNIMTDIKNNIRKYEKIVDSASLYIKNNLTEEAVAKAYVNLYKTYNNQ